MAITSGTFTSIPKYFYRNFSSYYDVLGAYHEFSNQSSFARLPGVGVDAVTWHRDSDWKVKVAKHLDASLPYYVSRHRCEPPEVRMAWRRPVGARYERWNSRIQWVPSFTLVREDYDLDQRALTSLKRAFASQRQLWKAIAPVRELNELRRPIRQINSLATDLIRALLEVKRTRGHSALKFASDVWLGYGFGIAPLFKDVEDAAKALARRLGGPPAMARIYKRASRITPITARSTLFLDGGTVGIEASANLRASLSYTYTAGFNTALLNAVPYSYSESLGTRLTDVLPALWELTAYSWVVDYFATVQPWLEDLFFDDGGSTIYVVKSRKLHVEGDLLYKPLVPKQVSVDSFSAGDAKYEMFEFSRTLLGKQLPRVALRWKSSDEVGLHALSKLLNLAALLVR